VEAALRQIMHPHKVNLASLGNLTPHLHWHVIPRFRDDPHFPQSIWSSRQRKSRRAAPADLAARLAATLAERLS
jgi:diadenosine tetraphosphate (Ap4A) HIT family hydrolase